MISRGERFRSGRVDLLTGVLETGRENLSCRLTRIADWIGPAPVLSCRLEPHIACLALRSPLLSHSSLSWTAFPLTVSPPRIRLPFPRLTHQCPLLLNLPLGLQMSLTNSRYLSSKVPSENALPRSLYLQLSMLEPLL